MEFKVIQNLAGHEGSVSGYFAVQSDEADHIYRILDCQDAILALGSSALCIPVVTDEFASGDSLNMLLDKFGKDLASYVTFGVRDQESDFQKSHVGVASREIGLDRPEFLSVLLEKPQPKRTLDGRSTVPLSIELRGLHMRFGTVVVSGETCVIEVNDTVPPLSQE